MSYEPMVGDIFSSSWGYDQTNVDFYKVVGVSPSGKSVKVRQLRGAAVEGEWSSVVAGDEFYDDCANCSGKVCLGPDGLYYHGSYFMGDDYVNASKRECWKPGKFAEPEVMTKRLKITGDGSSKYHVGFKVASYANAYLYRGEALYVTPLGYGH